MLVTKKKLLVPAPKCLTHLRAEHRCPGPVEKQRVLRLVFVRVKWEFQVQARLRGALLNSLSTESPTEWTRRGRRMKTA